MGKKKNKEGFSQISLKQYYLRIKFINNHVKLVNDIDF